MNVKTREKGLLRTDAFRGTLVGLVGTMAGMGITMLIRAAIGLRAWNEGPVVVIGIFIGMLCYLLALGVFNYWFRQAVGLAPIEERAPAKGWIRYFNVDTNHKIIGIQYFIISMVFLPFAVALQLVGRLDVSSSSRP